VAPDATGLPDLPVSDFGAPETPGLTCSAPRLNCDNNAANGCEADTSTSAAHCGRCNNPCNAGDTCSGGRCNPPAGVCPSSCRAESDCAPCRAAGDPGNYCCISGLCLYMTGACMSAPPDVPGTGGDAAPDGSVD